MSKVEGFLVLESDVEFIAKDIFVEFDVMLK